MSGTYDYLRTPKEIYARSAELVEAEANFNSVPPELRQIASRLVHSCAMPEIMPDIAWHGDPHQAGHLALTKGAPILCDSRMVSEGIIRSRLPASNAAICTLNQVPEAPPGDTRSAAAVEQWVGFTGNAVVAIGNAPTALFRLVELLKDNPGMARPSVILAFPVGFVGAAEAKEALIEADIGVPFVTLRGRFGGSPLAAAAVNALCGKLGE